jgi:hypothetical protein
MSYFNIFKLKLLPAIILFISFSCRSGEQSKQIENPAEKIRKEAVAIAEDYSRNQLKDAKVTANVNGFITVEDSLRKFIFDPARITTGYIDTDSLEDAIVTITSFNGEEINLIEHLILLNTNGKLMLIRSFEADMKILQLKDRILTVEVHTKPRTSPLYNCASCKAIINYKFKEGDLVKIE